MARPFRSALVLAAAATVLAACSGSPGTAAVIDGERLSDADIAAAGADYAAVTGSEASPGAIVYTLVDGLILSDIAGEYGVAFSDEEVVEYAEQVATQSGGEIPEEGLSPTFIELMRVLQVQGALSADPNGQSIVADFSAVRENAEVEVNPRYGALQEGQLVGTPRDWLAAGAQ